MLLINDIIIAFLLDLLGPFKDFALMNSLDSSLNRNNLMTFQLENRCFKFQLLSIFYFFRGNNYPMSWPCILRHAQVTIMPPTITGMERGNREGKVKKNKIKRNNNIKI